MTRSRLAAVAAVAAVSALACSAFAATARAAGCALEQTRGQGQFVGVTSEDVFAGGPSYRDCALSTQASAGVRVIRQTFRWSEIERSRGNYDFRDYDAYVADLARHRIRVLPILFDPPSFRSGAPERGAKHGTYPPRRYEDMGRFASRLVERYGPGGSFWREQPDVPQLPIRAWQVWNEPSIPPYWPDGPSPRQYTKLLKTTARYIKRADARAEIVTAGIPDSDLGISYGKFVAGMYKAGAKSAFDTLAVHPYATSAKGTVKTVSRIRKLMDQNHDRRARIWVTEMGWATSGPKTRFTFTEKGQATRISSAIRDLYDKRGKLRVRGVIYYGWKDSAPYPGRPDFWGFHTGLIDLNDRPKPGYYAFKQLASRLH